MTSWKYWYFYLAAHCCCWKKNNTYNKQKIYSVCNIFRQYSPLTKQIFFMLFNSGLSSHLQWLVSSQQRYLNSPVWIFIKMPLKLREWTCCSAVNVSVSRWFLQILYEVLCAYCEALSLSLFSRKCWNRSISLSNCHFLFSAINPFHM